MARNVDEEREARMTLSAVSEPSDVITGKLLTKLDAEQTLQLITSGDRLPNGIDPAEGELWRRRLAPRIDPGQIDRIRASMHAHGLRFLTPDDIDWPGELQQLGASAPIALWLKGDAGLLSAPLPDDSPSSVLAPRPHMASLLQQNSPQHSRLKAA